MVRRGRQPGYQNYSLDEQLLLCNVVEKFKPLGRNMWEDAAADDNERRARTWVRRDYESLKRKFRSLYSKKKPTGSNGDLQPRLVPIARAQEIQRAIEEKAGSHTMNDGYDGGEDDGQLLRDVEAALSPVAALPEGSTRDDEIVASDGSIDGEGDGDAAEEEESQANLPSVGGSPSSSSRSTQRRAVGTIITGSGYFDTSVADDVWSEPGAEEDSTREDETESSQPFGVRATPDSTSASQPAGSSTRTAAQDHEATEEAASSAVRASTGSSTPRSIGRPKGGSKRGKEARPTHASPEGPVLSRDPSRALTDAIEMQRNPKKSTASNRLGGIDLRVVRDNVEELTSKGNKRLTPDISGSGATYAANKRARAKKRLEQMQKDLDDATATQPSGAGEMMHYLVFMREEADRRSAEDDRRRREDREAKQEADKLERDERERVRRDEAAVAEVRRSQEMELARMLREDQSRKEAAAAEENRRRYEEHLERKRAEAQQRHEQILLLMTTMQRGNRESS